MEFVMSWEEGLASFVAIAKLCLESISVFCVVTGLLKTLRLVLTLRLRQRRKNDFSFNQVRIQFGTWLALALEFQLGADILSTTVAPTLRDLGQLAIVAIVRTFLNYFLNQELEAELDRERQQREQQLPITQE